MSAPDASGASRNTAPDSTAPIRVVVVDDQQLFVYGIRMLIESQPDLAVIGTANDGIEAVRIVTELQPDVVLMDIRMPRLDGIEATHRLTQNAASRAARVIVLTTFQREEAVYQAMKHGASAFLTKDSTPELVLATIRAVHSGDTLVAPAKTFALIRQFGAPGGRSRAPAPVEHAIAALTAREHEIFLLAARGLSNTEIAATAFISETTAKTHIRSILAKLHLRSRVQIVVFAYEHGLVRL